MHKLIIAICLTLSWLPALSSDAQYAKFFGEYTGQIEVGEGQQRRLTVKITAATNGYNISWKTIKSDHAGSGKTKAYSIDFTESQRQGIYGAAMKSNLFGGQIPLDPMKGEPYFWARIRGNTLTVFGLVITADGDYEIQRYDRTLIDGNLQLHYVLSTNGKVVKSIKAMLHKNPG